jgi:hypothetical protein
MILRILYIHKKFIDSQNSPKGVWLLIVVSPWMKPWKYEWEYGEGVGFLTFDFLEKNSLAFMGLVHSGPLGLLLKNIE